MEHLSQINPFLEGRTPPPINKRKGLYWQKKQEQQEQQEQQIREFYLMGERYPENILSAIDEAQRNHYNGDTP